MIHSFPVTIGFRYTSTRDPGPEGGIVNSSTFDANIGVYVETPSVIGEPDFAVYKTHVNYGSIGFKITNRRFLKIDNCLVYCEVEEPTATHYDLLLENVSYSKLTNNIHHFDVTGTRFHVRMIPGINACIGNEISGCKFRGNAFRAISVAGSGVSKTTLVNNEYGENLSGWWASNGNPDWLNPVDITSAGSPNGQHVGPVGSIFKRKDGGAGTSFYVKESGASNTNTGWVAK